MPKKNDNVTFYEMKFIYIFLWWLRDEEETNGHNLSGTMNLETSVRVP